MDSQQRAANYNSQSAIGRLRAERDDLALLLRRCLQRMPKDDALQQLAEDYLRCNNLMGPILRAEVDQSGAP